MKKFLLDMLKKAHLFTILDYGILKWTLVLFGIWLATLIPALTTVNPWIYGVLWFVGRVYLVWKMFKGKKHKQSK